MTRLVTTLLTCLSLSTLALAQYEGTGDLKLARPEDKAAFASTPPPAGATVLLAGPGSDASAMAASLERDWVKVEGGPPAWAAQAGAVQVQGGGIKTKKTFDGHFKLHVEFRCPYEPNDMGQARGNSGVYLQGRYEVQVLDSYGLDSKDNDCGGIYEVAKPRANACKAPTVWQAYDIEFWAPKCQDGKVVTPAQISVWHNGVQIHEHQPLERSEGGKTIIVDNTRAGLGGDPCTAGPIHLQDHGDAVQYRNIWLLPLSN